MPRNNRQLRKARYVIYRETLINPREHFYTFLGTFFGIGIIGFINSKYFVLNDNLFLIGSFGASSVLIYGAVNSPLAQPRNLTGGHLLSAFIGVSFYKLLPEHLYLSAGISVALSTVMMQITKTLHPPGGATALIANIGSSKIHALGYWFILSPVLSGVLILLVLALVFNNLSPDRVYPVNLKKNAFLLKIFRFRKTN